MYARTLVRSRIKLSNGDLYSLDFSYNCTCMKLFRSSNVELIKECQSYFRCVLPSLAVKERSQKFISKYDNPVDPFCQSCSVL